MLTRVIEQRRALQARSSKPDETFDALLRSIVYQQLNGRAASTIHARVLAHFPKDAAALPKTLLATPDAKLRAAGLSANKLRAMRDLADKCLKGVVPAARKRRRCPTRSSSSA